MEKIRVSVVGAAAQESMRSFSGGRIAGVTSKGAFLRAGDRILFLTAADYRSPFNLTLEGTDELFSVLQPGDSFTFSDDGINFPTREFSLITGNAEVWTPSPPVAMHFSPEQQQQRASRLIQRVRERDASKGFLFLALPSDEITAANQRHLQQSASKLVRAFRITDKESFTSSAQKLMGAGGGLTPSGDDFLAGFFLFHFRAIQAGAKEPGFLQDWWAELTRLAFEKTTTISANRLEYTARGWSEELFLRLIDHLFNPEVEFGEESVRHIMEFGHSSGVDTLMGISYALDSLQ